ncbi:MAG: hypothetical protein U0S36_15435 [Candidatus Nanopelagicales bacterium]
MSRPNRRRAIRAVAPVAGLLAAGLLVWQGSYAAFSASTDNTADAWTTGQLALTNNGGTGTTYTGTTTGIFGSGTPQPETNMKPGATGAKCITVQSGGNLAGNIKLFRGAIGGTNGPALANQLNLTITAAPVGAGVNVLADCATFPATGTTSIYTGTLTGMPTAYGLQTGMGVTAGVQKVAYRIGWTFASTGTNSGDNALQSSSATADLTWEIQ